MNTLNEYKIPKLSLKKSSTLGLISIVSSMVMSSCVLREEGYPIGYYIPVYKPLPYRPLSEVLKDSSEDESKRNKGTDSVFIYEPNPEEEFVDDNGNIYTREQLESGNQ